MIASDPASISFVGRYGGTTIFLYCTLCFPHCLSFVVGGAREFPLIMRI